MCNWPGTNVYCRGELLAKTDFLRFNKCIGLSHPVVMPVYADILPALHNSVLSKFS